MGTKRNARVLFNETQQWQSIELCRLLDLLDTQDVSLSQIEVVVLDECDKMLSLGFAKELSRFRELLLEPPAGGVVKGESVATGVEGPCIEAKSEKEGETAAEQTGEEQQGDIVRTKKSKKRCGKREGESCNKVWLTFLEDLGAGYVLALCSREDRFTFLLGSESCRA
jgi:DEAD/DEAH box helicase